MTRKQSTPEENSSASSPYAQEAVERAYQEGLQAAAEGKELNDNPYAASDEEDGVGAKDEYQMADAWDQGYQSQEG